jgi:hypothetical protein
VPKLARGQHLPPMFQLIRGGQRPAGMGGWWPGRHWLPMVDEASGGQGWRWAYPPILIGASGEGAVVVGGRRHSRRRGALIDSGFEVCIDRNEKSFLFLLS